MSMMERFMDWYHGNNDTEQEPPKKGAPRVWYVIRNYGGKLVLVNILFLLCCLPVVTIPAALAALNRYISKIFRTGYGFTMGDYWKEFKQSLLKCLPLGILSFVLGFYAYYLLSVSGNFEGSPMRDMIFGIGIGVLIFDILLTSYVFVMTAMLDLPNRYLLKNALILMIAEWKNSLILAAETFVFAGIILAAAPYSFWLIFLGYSIQQLIVYAIVEPAVNKRIIEPYEKSGRR